MPTVSKITPSSGPFYGGVKITVTGTGFASLASVFIGDSKCLDVRVQSREQLTCVTPNGRGGQDVVVHGGKGVQSKENVYFKFLGPIQNWCLCLVFLSLVSLLLL